MMHLFNRAHSAILQEIGIYETLQIIVVSLLVLVAFITPKLGLAFFGRIERAIKTLAGRPYWAVMSILIFAIVGRAAMIPFIGTAEPFVPDDASLLLQAQTYLTGHLSNPVLPPNFESIYAISKPSYASMYPVLRSFPLFFGALLGVGFWVGEWMSVILLCVMLFLALRLWVSPAYALVAAYIAVIRIGFFSFWVNSYFGAAFTALGGLLVMSGYTLIKRRPTALNGAILGLGAFILMTTRPYEGLLYAAPVALFLIVDFFRAAPAPRRALAVSGAAAMVFVLAGLGLTMASNQAVTGSWRIEPYDQYRKTTASVPAFFIGKRSDPHLSIVRYEQTQGALHREDKWYDRRQSIKHIARAEFHRMLSYWNFYVGAALILPFVIGVFVLRRQPVLLSSLGALTAGLMFVTWDHSQYASPAFAVALLIEIAGLAAMRGWSPGGRPVGLALSRLLPTAIVVGLTVPVSIAVADYPVLKFGINNITTSACCWIRPPHFHATIDSILESAPGDDIVAMDSGPRADPAPTIVFNDADIAHERVIWIHDDPQYNAQTFAQYPGRKHWWLGWLDDGSPCFMPYEQQFGPSLGASGAGAHDSRPRGPCRPGLPRP